MHHCSFAFISLASHPFFSLEVLHIVHVVPTVDDVQEECARTGEQQPERLRPAGVPDREKQRSRIRREYLYYGQLQE